jgi:hypothetical protein
MAEAQRVLNVLYTRRDMTPNEVRTLATCACASRAPALRAPAVACAARTERRLPDMQHVRLCQVRLVMMIEDPRAARRREAYGIEVESGVSRDDLVAALAEVQAGRVPPDRLALEQVVTELLAWPYLEDDDALRAASAEPSPYAAVTNTGLSEAARRAQALRARGAEEEATPEKDLSDYLPNWVGYSAVYLVSAIPVFITIAVLLLLFVTSLK